MIAVMAAFAEGTTIIRDAQELKVKESDRIAVMVDNLKRMGADIEGTEDGMIIHGGRPLHGAAIDSHLDHRVAMSFAVAGTICDGTVDILNGDCVKISYPEFYNDLYSLRQINYYVRNIACHCHENVMAGFIFEKIVYSPAFKRTVLKINNQIIGCYIILKFKGGIYENFILWCKRL